MQICSIASGSSGNCIYVGSETTHVLVDVGISKKRIEIGLESIGLKGHEIQGIFITHEHSDHIKGLGVMSRKYAIPIYTTAKTWHKILADKTLGFIEPELHREIRADESLLLGDLTINPFKTSHDSIDPVCYTFQNEGKKISVATDLGCYDDYVRENLEFSNVLFIEANHDVRMLEVGKYPYFLKQRILGDFGHLSNETSGRLICDLAHEGLSHIVLGHLSQENNMPDLAYESVKIEIDELLRESDKNLQLTVAKRNSVSELIKV